MWVSVVAALATVVWVVPVLLSRGHGFDVSDEGSYVLSYRWWDSDARNFNGAQYLYGPVFAALDHSVAGLRVVRLVSVVAAHAVFGWAFMSWLQMRYPSAVPGRSGVVAGTLSIVAVGGVTYGWLPLSPGYNDVVALGCLIVMAVLFRTWRAVLLTGRLPLLPALLLPVPVLAMVLGKWSSAVVALFFLVVVFAVVAAALRPTGWGRYVGAGVLGTGVVVALFDLLVAPLGTVVPPMVAVNRLAAGSSHSAGTLLTIYAEGLGDIAGRTTILLVLVALLGLLGVLLARAGFRTAARWTVVAGPVVVVVVVAVRRQPSMARGWRPRAHRLLGRARRAGPRSDGRVGDLTGPRQRFGGHGTARREGGAHSGARHAAASPRRTGLRLGQLADQPRRERRGQLVRLHRARCRDRCSGEQDALVPARCCSRDRGAVRVGRRRWRAAASLPHHVVRRRGSHPGRRRNSGCAWR